MTLLFDMTDAFISLWNMMTFNLLSAMMKFFGTLQIAILLTELKAFAKTTQII